MATLLVHWLLSALGLLIVAHVVPGFRVAGFGSALLAALVIGFVNATVGLALKLLTLPLTILTFGFFLLVINALMLQLASAFVPGFSIAGFGSALIGAIVLALVGVVLRSLLIAA